MIEVDAENQQSDIVSQRLVKFPSCFITTLSLIRNKKEKERNEKWGKISLEERGEWEIDGARLDRLSKDPVTGN